MTSHAEYAARYVRIAEEHKLLGEAESYKTVMRIALSQINKIESPDHRRKCKSKWFSAFNTTNTRLQKEAL